MITKIELMNDAFAKMQPTFTSNQFCRLFTAMGGHVGHEGVSEYLKDFATNKMRKRTWTKMDRPYDNLIPLNDTIQDYKTHELVSELKTRGNFKIIKISEVEL
jgi:hypothetical protein